MKIVGVKKTKKPNKKKHFTTLKKQNIKTLDHEIRQRNAALHITNAGEPKIWDFIWKVNRAGLNENLYSVFVQSKSKHTHMYTAVAVQRSEGTVCGDLGLSLVNVTRL